jgi:hypothetical protein
MVAVQDFVIPAGQTMEFVVDVRGGPTSLTGYVGSMMIRELRTDTAPLVTVDPSNITINPSTRQVKVTIPGDDTESYTFRRGVYDLVITGPGGDEWRLVEGRVINNPAVTRGA